MNKEILKSVLPKCNNVSDILRELKLSDNGRTRLEINNTISDLHLDISHFGKPRSKYETITKTCPVCNTTFKTQKGHVREQTTCSYSCSNSFFRRGVQNGNWKDDSYRSTCFEYHDKKCVCCDEKNIVAVHHFDENSDNNNPENLIPMCPTHHQY